MTTNAATPPGSELADTGKPGEASPGLLNRYSPTVQVGVVAAAIIPSIVLYVAYWLTPSPDDPYLSVAELAVFCLVYGVYFVGVIWLVNKYPRRRKYALTAAILTVVVDTVVSCLFGLPDVQLGAFLMNAVYVAITVAYVAVWGIARRQTKVWIVGLPFAAMVSWQAQFRLYQHDGRNYWWEPWTCFVATFVIGCVFCWAFDLLGRRAESRGARALGLDEQ